MKQQAYIDYIKSIFPKAVMDFWFPYGEQQFYPTPGAEHPYSCIRRGGRFVILTEF